MTETAAPAAAPQITIAPTPSDSGESDMFSDASSFHEFQSMANKRSKESRAQAKQQKVEAKATPPATTAPPPVAEPTESLHPPTETPQQDAPDETLETDEPVTETPPDPAAEAAQAADAELLGKVKEWMAGSGEMPDVFKEMLHRVPGPSGDRWETYDEIIKGNMRQDDHTRGWQEATEIKRQAAEEVGAYRQHFEQIEHPDPVTGGEAMYEVYTRGKRRAAAMEFARRLANDEQEDRTHASGYAMAFARRERLIDPQTGEPLWNHRDVNKAFDTALKERERVRTLDDIGRERDWQLERERAKTQQTQQQQKQVEVNKTVENQIAQMRPRAFKQLGIADDAETQVLFRRKLAARAEQTGAAVLTPELVMEAARMTRDHIARERNGAPAPKQQPRTFQPQLGSGAGKIAGSTKQDDLADDDAFARKFKLRHV